MQSTQYHPRDLIEDIPWRRANEVIDGLWIGRSASAVTNEMHKQTLTLYHAISLESACSLRLLHEKSIHSVISVCEEAVPWENPALGVVHERIRIADDPAANLLSELPRACMLIAVALAQGQNVFIHSARGQNRAAAVVAAYRAFAVAGEPVLYADQLEYSDADERNNCERRYGLCSGRLA
jgi:hypothetical protein